MRCVFGLVTLGLLAMMAAGVREEEGHIDPAFLEHVLQAHATEEPCDACACPNECSGHGDCVDAVCKCHNGWTGSDCSGHACPEDCSHHGLCNHKTGMCACYPPFYGRDCSKDSTVCPECPPPSEGDHHHPQPSPNVVFVEKCLPRPTQNATTPTATPTAAPTTNRTGNETTTEEKTCPRDCCGHGLCDTTTGGCLCLQGFMGEDCCTPLPSPSPAPSCPNNCTSSEHGRCNTETWECHCYPPWFGADCSFKMERRCPNDCSGHGWCEHTWGKCHCEAPWMGEDCSAQDCPNACSGHGICNTELGKCACYEPWTGEDCSANMTLPACTCPSTTSPRDRFQHNATANNTIVKVLYVYCNETSTETGDRIPSNNGTIQEELPHVNVTEEGKCPPGYHRRRKTHSAHDETCPPGYHTEQRRVCDEGEEEEEEEEEEKEKEKEKEKKEKEEDLSDEEALLRDYFIKHDKDKDNRLSLTELAVIFQDQEGGAHVPPEQVAWGLKLMDTDKDGFISFEEFLQFYHVFSKKEGEPFSEEDQVHTLFHIYDVNGDDKISVKELASMTQELSQGRVTQEQAQEILNALDTNHDGTLDIDEFTKWWLAEEEEQAVPSEQEMDAEQRGAYDYFMTFDLDKDGKLNVTEMAHLLATENAAVSEADVEWALQLMDTDQDHAVTFPEFYAFYRMTMGVEKGEHVHEVMTDEEGLQEIFNLHDRDHDGKLSIDELSGLALELSGGAATPEEIHDAMQVLDEDEDGHLTFDEFAAWFEEDEEKTEEKTEKEKEGMEAFFDSFDKNKDGLLETGELEKLMAGRGENVSREEVEWAVRLMDTNRDGMVNFEEFYGFMRIFQEDTDLTSREGMHMVFNVYDSDGDGKVTLQELTLMTVELSRGTVSKEVVEEAFHVGDENEDGVLTFDEFFKWFTQTEMTRSVEAEEKTETAEAFHHFDKDHDGFLNIEEFAAMLMAGDPSTQRGDIAWGLRLVDTNKDGKISLEELQTYTHVFSGDAEPFSKPEHIRFLFDLYDADGDGFLSLGEATLFAHELVGPELDPDEVYAGFQEMDTDKNRKISREEFQAWFAKQEASKDQEDQERAGVRQEFDRLDKNHDGFLSREEAEGMFGEEGLPMIIKALDRDRDNRVSFDELWTLYTAVRDVHDDPNAVMRIVVGFIFDAYDVNHDGRITVEEVAAIIQDFGIDAKNQEEMQQVLAFLDTDGDGAVSKGEMIRFIENMEEEEEAAAETSVPEKGGKSEQREPEKRGEAPPKDQAQRDALQKWFHKQDANGDGKLDLNEVHQAIRQHTEGQMSDEEIAWLFRLVDTDKDGFINFEECLAAFKIFEGMDEDKAFTKPEQVNILFNLYDVDKDGALDVRELASLVHELSHGSVSEEEAAGMFAMLDTNGDQRLTFAEFYGWWSQAQSQQHQPHDQQHQQQHLYQQQHVTDPRMDDMAPERIRSSALFAVTKLGSIFGGAKADADHADSSSLKTSLRNTLRTDLTKIGSGLYNGIHGKEKAPHDADTFHLKPLHHVPRVNTRHMAPAEVKAEVKESVHHLHEALDNTLPADETALKEHPDAQNLKEHIDTTVRKAAPLFRDAHHGSVDTLKVGALAQYEHSRLGELKDRVEKEEGTHRKRHHHHHHHHHRHHQSKKTGDEQSVLQDSGEVLVEEVERLLKKVF